MRFECGYGDGRHGNRATTASRLRFHHMERCLDVLAAFSDGRERHAEDFSLLGGEFLFSKFLPQTLLFCKKGSARSDVASKPLERPPNGERSRLKVNIDPLKAQHFAAP